MSKFKLIFAFAIGYGIGFALFTLGGIVDLYLHPWIAETEWTWLHFISRHCLGIAWNSGVLWPHIILSTLAGLLGVWMRYDKG